MPHKNDKSLRELFINKIRALYDIENELVKALPKMAKATTDEELCDGFNDHHKETKEHAKRLEEIFTLLELKPSKLKVDAIRGLVNDGDWVMKNIPKGDARDANLAAAARYVEHYEIAGYTAACDWAVLLDEDEIASLLNQTLKEEGKADRKLGAALMTISKRVRPEKI